MAATSRRYDVVTFPSRDVGSTNTEVNNLERCDTATSGRLNVAMLQRRDVNSRSAPHHLKYEWLINQGIGRRTKEGKEFQSRSDTDFDEVPGICIVSIYFGY